MTTPRSLTLSGRARFAQLTVATILFHALFVATSVSAQGAPAADTAVQAGFVLPGRVIGPDGELLAGQEVVLHRVAGGVGGTTAMDTTDADGRFVLETESGPLDATYFVAARYFGELYIGPPFQPPLPTGIDYTVQVGVPETSATVLMGGGTAQPPPVMPMRTEPFPYMRWVLLVVPLLIVALVGGYMLTRRRTPMTRRRLLVEIAELDETHESELSAGNIQDSTLYWAERRVLLEQLTRTS